MEVKTMGQVVICEENRFSTFVKSKKSEGYRDLERWQRWFAERGIPSVIASTPSGYALYRNGLIQVDIHDDRPARAAA